MPISTPTRRLHAVIAFIATAGLILATPAAPASAEPQGHAPQAPTGLTVDDRSKPLNTGTTPAFGWLPQDVDTNEVQTAYELEVRKGSNVVWSSGKQDKSAQSNVRYAGDALSAGTAYTWRVRTWDKDGNESPWSGPSTFETGIADNQWDDARWIKRPSANSAFAATGGKLRYTGNASQPITLANTGTAWTDYEISMKVTPVATAAGIIFRAPTSANGYMWQLTPGTGLKTHRLVAGAFPTDARRTVALTITAGQTYAVKIRVQGKTFTTWIDGTQVDTWTDPSSTGSNAGTIGFREANLETGEFDDVVVTSLDGSTVLFSDDFSNGTSQWAAGAGSQEADDWTLARKQVDLQDKEVVRARAYTSGVHTYELFLNGQRADRGSSFGYSGEGYYQAADVTGLVQGKSKLAVGAILHWYGSGQGRSANAPGLLVKVVVEYADGTKQTIVTDNTWKVRRGPWGNSGTRNGEGDVIETYDAVAAKAIGNWKAVDFDASAWSAPIVVGAHPISPFTHLSGSETRVSETVVKPKRILIANDGTPVADFGTVIPARPSVHFDSGQANRVITIRGSYELQSNGRVGTDGRSTQSTNMSWPYTQVDGDQTYDVFTHLGFRYLEVPGAGEDFTVDDITATVVHSDFPTEQAATFDSSSDTLNGVWGMLKRSLEYSVQEVFVDTPTREKGQFLNDTINISDGLLVTAGDRTASRQAMREFLASQRRFWTSGADAGRFNAVYPNGDGKRDIPDFTLMVPEWVWDYYVATGDKAMLAEAYDSVRATADYVKRHIPTTGNTAGLVTRLTGGTGQYQYGIVDWPAVGRFDYDMTAYARTTVNALGVSVLDRVSDIGEVLGKSETDIADLRATQQQLVDSMNTKLRRADGRYVDGLKSDGTQTSHAGQHATSYAVAFGVAPSGDRATLATSIAADGMKQGPMTAHWLLEALRAGDNAQGVFDRLTDTASDGWAKAVSDGLTFTPEAWVYRTGENSQSHGWGAQAAVDLFGTVLGVQVVEPGAAKLSVTVPRITLDHAEGTVHTQRGPVKVDWKRTTDLYTTKLEVPVNTKTTVSVPVAAGHRLKVTGGTAGPVTIANGRAVVEVGSGSWTFTEKLAPGGTVSGTVSAAGDEGWSGNGAQLTVTAAGADEDSVIEYKVGEMDWTTYETPVDLASGSYAVKWRLRNGDDVLNEGSQDVKVDTVAPLVVAEHEDRKVTVTAVDGASGVKSVEAKVDDGDWAAYTEPIELDSDAHTVGYRATDVAGNDSEEFSLDVPAVYDGGAPTATVSKAGEDGWYGKGATLTLAADGADNFQYRTDGGGWVNYTAPVELADGAATIEFRARSANESWSEVGSIDVKVDSVLPEASGTFDADDRTITLSADDADSGVAGIEYRIDDGEWKSYDAPLEADDDSHTVTYRASDVAGNASEEGEVEVPAIYNGGTPEASVSKAGEDGWYGKGAKLTLSAGDAASIEYRIGDGEWNTYTAPVALEDGSATIGFRAKSSNGATSETGSIDVKVDSVLPIAQGSFDDDRKVTLSATDADSGVGTIEYKVDDNDWQEYSEPLQADEDDHTVSYRATDVAGNTSEVGQVEVAAVYNADEPSASVSEAGSDGWYGDGAKLTLTADGAASIEYRIGDDDWDDYDGPVGLDDGSATIEFRATSSNGATSEIGSIDVKVDSVVPVAQASFDEDDRTVTLTATDGDSGVGGIAYKLDDGQWLTYVEPFQVDGAAHTVTYRASDVAGNVSAGSTLEVDEVPAGPVPAPVATVLPSVSGKAQFGATLTARSGTWDPTSTQFTYQWLRDGAPIAGATRTTYRLAVADVGHRLAVQVTATAADRAPGVAQSERTSTVAKAPTKTVGKVSKRSVKSGKKVTVSAKVTASGVTPSGKVQLFYRGRFIKTLTLKNGAIKTTFKTKKKGRNNFTIVYVGDGGTYRSSSTVAIRVR